MVGQANYRMFGWMGIVSGVASVVAALFAQLYFTWYLGWKWLFEPELIVEYPYQAYAPLLAVMGFVLLLLGLALIWISKQASQKLHTSSKTHA